jgi:hypothetical protein
MGRPPLEVADLIRSGRAAFIERNRQWLDWKHGSEPSFRVSDLRLEIFCCTGERAGIIWSLLGVSDAMVVDDRENGPPGKQFENARNASVPANSCYKFSFSAHS